MLVRVRKFARRWFSSWFSMALVFVFAAVAAGVGLGQSISRQVAPNLVATATTKTVVLESNELLSERYWQERRLRKIRSRQNSGRDRIRVNPFDNAARKTSRPNVPARRRSQSAKSNGGNYRTVCVRLCDGYYFPISASTNKKYFGVDEQACQSRCSSDARLYYYRNAGGSPETMKDRRGRTYADMKTAFLYRTTYNKSCQCRPDPWSQQAKQRHAMYTTKEWQQRTRRLARLEKRRVRRQPRRSVYRSKPAVIASESAQNGTITIFPPSTRRTVRPQRYSQVRMGLGRPATIRRQQPRRRNKRRTQRKAWRSKVFGRID